MGDSYTNAHGLKDVEARFVNRIRAERPAWQVDYVGRDGLETGEIVASLEKLIREGYQLDIVTYVYCPNDLSDLIEEWTRVAQVVYRYRPSLLFRHSWFLNTWYYRLRVGFDPQLAGYFDYIEAAYGDERWTLQQHRLERLQTVVESADGRLLMVTFPFFETLADERWRAIYRQLGAYWAEQGVAHLDLSSAYEGLPIERLAAHRYDTHPSAEAHAIAAERIATFIDRQLGNRQGF